MPLDDSPFRVQQHHGCLWSASASRMVRQGRTKSRQCVWVGFFILFYFIYFCLACFIFFLTLYCLIARFCFYHSKIKRETFLKKKTKCTSTNVNLDSHEPLGNGYIKMSNIKSICFISATPYDQIRFWNYKYCIPVQL